MRYVFPFVPGAQFKFAVAGGFVFTAGLPLR